jgi:hypothetical protein
MAIQFVHRSQAPVAVTTLLRELRGVLPHGGALFAQFDVVDPPSRVWWADWPPHMPEQINLDAFLRSAALATALPELRADQPSYEEPRWQMENLFRLPGAGHARRVVPGTRTPAPAPPSSRWFGTSPGPPPAPPGTR